MLRALDEAAPAQSSSRTYFLPDRRAFGIQILEHEAIGQSFEPSRLFRLAQRVFGIITGARTGRSGRNTGFEMSQARVAIRYALSANQRLNSSLGGSRNDDASSITNSTFGAKSA